MFRPSRSSSGPPRKHIIVLDKFKTKIILYFPLYTVFYILTFIYSVFIYFPLYKVFLYTFLYIQCFYIVSFIYSVFIYLPLYIVFLYTFLYIQCFQGTNISDKSPILTKIRHSRKTKQLFDLFSWRASG